MIGDTITVTVNAVSKVLTKINQDQYGAEYYLKSATDEFRMKIRHQKESPQKDGRFFDRHNVELTHVVYATLTVPELRRVSSFTIRDYYSDDALSVRYASRGLADWMATPANMDKVINWES